MTSSGDKAKENRNRPRQSEQARRRRPDALSLLSSLVSFDDPADPHTPKLSSPIPLSLEVMQSQPLPLGLIRERDVSVRKTLSQDWLKERFSPRPSSQERDPFSAKSPSLAKTRQGPGRSSLASIAEDDHDTDSDVSGDLPMTTEHEITDKIEALSVSQATARPSNAAAEGREPKIESQMSKRK